MNARLWRCIPLTQTRRSCLLCASVLALLHLAPAHVAVAQGTPEMTTLVDFTFEHSLPSASKAGNTWITNLAAEAGSGTASAKHQDACIYASPSGNGSHHSFGATNWNVGDFWQFTCAAAGASNINVSFDLVGSALAPAGFQLQYSLNGSSFTNFGSRYTTAQNGDLTGPLRYWSGTASNSLTHYTTNLSSVTALNGATLIWFRLVDVSSNSIAGGAVGSYGVARVDNFLVAGTLLQASAPVVVTWAIPGAITYGVPLDNTELNASANVAGTFTYEPAPGEILDTGSRTLTVLFTPSATNYNSVSNSVVLPVNRAPLTVSAYNAARTVGATNPIFSGTIFGLVNTDSITATYSCVATASRPAGDYNIVPALSDPGFRLTNYIAATNYGTLTVSTGAVEQIILAEWNFNTNLAPVAAAGGIWYTSLSATLGSGTASAWHANPTTYSSLLGSGATNLPGTNNALVSTNWSLGDYWQFTLPISNATALSVACDQSSSVRGPLSFALRLSANGSTSSQFQTYYLAAVNCITNDPMLLMPEGPETRLIFNLQGASGLTGATNLTIRLTDAGNTSASGGLVGPDGTNVIYDFVVYGAVPLPPGTPVISWTPQAITYGTPLGAGQLNATASTYGTFSYAPGAGTILPAGTNTLSVVFTPSDPTYLTVSNTLSFVVAYAPYPTLIEPTALSPGVFQFAISNIGPGAGYTVLFTPDLKAPITNWTVIGSASYVSPGLYQFVDTNAAAGNGFYTVRSQ